MVRVILNPTGRICLIMIIFPLVLILAGCIPKAPMARPATLTVEPHSGKAGTALVLNGSQFLSGEEVEIIMAVGDVYHSLGTEKQDVIKADENGNFKVTSGIPVLTPPGTYQIKATGSRGSVAIFSLTVIK